MENWAAQGAGLEARAEGGTHLLRVYAWPVERCRVPVLEAHGAVYRGTAASSGRVKSCVA